MDQPTASDGVRQIPSDYLALYQQAGKDYGIPWTVVAGIGKVESDHGRSKLKGVNSGENYAGAGGPMQFLQPTWNQYGVDGNDDGKRSRYDPADAVPGAANYLRSSGAPGNVKKAIFAYNHLNSYVDLVLSWSEKYGNKVEAVQPSASICNPGEQGDANNPPGSTKHRSPRVGVVGCKPVTQALIDELDTVLGPYVIIGCNRPGDPRDHGSGHATDLMVSSGGKRPGPAGEALGNRTASYAIANYRRLRVKYIIWRQRIWNPGICKCWRPMGDRGSITQNHYDHPHISTLG